MTNEVLDSIRDEKLIQKTEMNYEELNWNDGYEAGFNAAIELINKFHSWDSEQFHGEFDDMDLIFI